MPFKVWNWYYGTQCWYDFHEQRSIPGLAGRSCIPSQLASLDFGSWVKELLFIISKICCIFKISTFSNFSFYQKYIIMTHILISSIHSHNKNDQGMAAPRSLQEVFMGISAVRNLIKSKVMQKQQVWHARFEISFSFSLNSTDQLFQALCNPEV